MKKIICGNRSFEIVDHIPAGFQIWNIGKNMVDGYLPLCRLKRASEQPFEGGMDIEPDTLKAIKTEGAQTILAAIGFGPNDIPSMVRYLKKYSGSKTPYVMRRVARIEAALAYMHQLKWN